MMSREEKTARERVYRKTRAARKTNTATVPVVLFLSASSDDSFLADWEAARAYRVPLGDL